jgi:hypothetical protein
VNAEIVPPRGTTPQRQRPRWWVLHIGGGHLAGNSLPSVDEFLPNDGQAGSNPKVRLAHNSRTLRRLKRVDSLSRLNIPEELLKLRLVCLDHAMAG